MHEPSNNNITEMHEPSNNETTQIVESPNYEIPQAVESSNREIPQIKKQNYKQALFKKNLDALEVQVNNLKTRRDNQIFGSNDYIKLNAAYDTALTLHLTLKKAGEQYFNQEIAFSKFKSVAQEAIDKAKPILEQQRGFKAILETLINFICSFWNNRFTHFKLPTESMKKIEALEKTVNKIGPEA